MPTHSRAKQILQTTATLTWTVIKYATLATVLTLAFFFHSPSAGRAHCLETTQENGIVIAIHDSLDCSTDTDCEQRHNHGMLDDEPLFPGHTCNQQLDNGEVDFAPPYSLYQSPF